MAAQPQQITLLQVLQANLCLTSEDIDDDSGKGTTVLSRAPPDIRTFFDTCKNQLITQACAGETLLRNFDIFIQAQIDRFNISQPLQVYKYNIPHELFATRAKFKKKKTETILIRIMTDTALLEDECKPFFCVKDNYGFKKIEERFILASFFDEGGRRLQCGQGNTIRTFLTRIYGGVTNYTIDLFVNGMTTTANSTLTAHWDPQGDGTLVNVLNDNEILFTLTIGTDYVKCIFSYNEEAHGNGRYTSGGKIAVSCSFLHGNTEFARDFILACFSGNSDKNIWFNRYYVNIDNLLFVSCGMFIQLGKAIGDASFVFSKDGFTENPGGKKFSVASSDKALGLRCCINNTNVILVTTRGAGGIERFYMSMEMEDLAGLLRDSELPPLQKKPVSGKKTKANEKFKIKVGDKKVYRKVNEDFKKKYGRDSAGRSLRNLQLGRRRQGTSYLLLSGGKTKNVNVTWGENHATVDLIFGDGTVGDVTVEDTIGHLKQKLKLIWKIDESRMEGTKFIIAGKTYKNDSDKIPADTKKIMIICTKPNIQSVLEKVKENTNASNTTTDSIVSTSTTDLESEFKNYSSEYLQQMLYFIKCSLENFSELQASLSNFNSDDNTITYDGLTYIINKDTFNLDVKKLCVEKVYEFLNLLVINIEDKNLRIKLVQIVANTIVKKEDIFDIKKVLDNIPFSDTLVIPVPDETKKLCGVPTTYLFEGCEKLLSFLDGISGFEKDFFKPIYNKINDLNTESKKKYTINTIFSDVDSKPITALSLKKVTDEESQPPHIHLLKSLQTKLTELKNNPQHDLTDSQEESQEEYIKKIQEILNDITRILDESSKLQKYEVYNEISKVLTKLLIIIEYSDLLLMIVSSFIDDELVAIVIINELSRFISIRGTFIFDIKIIEAFIDGLDVDETLGSIVYKQGYDAIDALISVKQYFDGDLIDTLNDKGFSLKQIGDFMNNLISEAIEQDITDDEHIDQLITTSLDSLEPIFQQLEQQEQIRQPLDPMGLREVDQTNQLKEKISVTNGGKNNRISNPNPKQNTKYRKKYKKFVSKYIIKKNKNKNKNNKNNNKNNKNKTRKNKRLTKSTPNSKRNNKTLKNKKRKSKSSKHKSNHKSKHNKKTKTNYYNYYRDNKTLKH